MERRSKPPLAGASGQLNIINLHGQQPGKPCNIRAGDSPSTLGTDPKRWFWRETKDEGRELSVHLPRRLTHPRIPIKLEESNRGCPDPREGAAIPFCSCLLGGRPIGRTPDSGSGYPGSSPGLPANLLLTDDGESRPFSLNAAKIRCGESASKLSWHY